MKKKFMFKADFLDNDITLYNGNYIEYTNDEGLEYYDLYNKYGHLVACDGETVLLEKLNEEDYVLSNENCEFDTIVDVEELEKYFVYIGE